MNFIYKKLNIPTNYGNVLSLSGSSLGTFQTDGWESSLAPVSILTSHQKGNLIT